jgi:integrase
VSACRLWLDYADRQHKAGTGLAERTLKDYRGSFERYVDTTASKVLGLSLAEGNNSQRLRRFLQDVADKHGTGAAKMTRSVLSGTLRLAVADGVLATNAMRQVDGVKSTNPKPTRKGKEPRDITRAFTRKERDSIVAYADAEASKAVQPRTKRKLETTADFCAFMAGTGARISEARMQLWADINLENGRVEIRGTKTGMSHRSVTMPAWLLTRMRARAERVGTAGYVFAAPSFVKGPRRLAESKAGQVEWYQSNCARAVRETLDGAGFEWATPHSFRRTVATLAHEGGAPIMDIADQLGHADPSMTARVYLGRDPFGERATVAQHL